jgi:hypothetical protein
MDVVTLLLVASVAYLFYRVRQLSHDLKKKVDRPFYETYTPTRYFSGLEERLHQGRRWFGEQDDLGGSEE